MVHDHLTACQERLDFNSFERTSLSTKVAYIYTTGRVLDNETVSGEQVD
jgi:hypothetical protein